MSPTVQFEGDRGNNPSINTSSGVFSSSLKAPERNQPISVDCANQVDKSSTPKTGNPSQVPDFSSESDDDENDRTAREQTDQRHRRQKASRNSLRRSRSQLSLESSPSESELPRNERTKLANSLKLKDVSSGELSAKKIATLSVTKRPRLTSDAPSSGENLNGGPEMRPSRFEGNANHIGQAQQNGTSEPHSDGVSVAQATILDRNGSDLVSNARPPDGHDIVAQNPSPNGQRNTDDGGEGINNGRFQNSDSGEPSSREPQKIVTPTPDDSDEMAQPSPLTDKNLVNIMPFPELDASGWDRFIFFSHRPQRFDFKEKTYLSTLSPFSAVTSCMDNVSISNVCAVCGAGGRLRNCTRCKLAFHASCLAMPMNDKESDKWMCIACRSACTRNGSKGPPPLPSPNMGLRRLTIDVQEGNPIDSVLNPSLFIFYKEDVGADWLKCRKCGRIRLVEDGVLSESVHIPFVCSQAFWLAGADRECTFSTGDVPMLSEEEQHVSERLKIRSRMRNALFFHYLGEENRESYGFPALPNEDEEAGDFQMVGRHVTKNHQENAGGMKGVIDSRTGQQRVGVLNDVAVKDKSSVPHETRSSVQEQGLQGDGEQPNDVVEVAHPGKTGRERNNPQKKLSRHASSSDNVLFSFANADALNMNAKSGELKANSVNETRVQDSMHVERANENFTEHDSRRSNANEDSQLKSISSVHPTGETAVGAAGKISEGRERGDSNKVESVDPVQVELLQVIGNLGFEQVVEDGLADMALRDDKMLLSLFAAYGRSQEGLDKFRRQASRLARKLGLGNAATVASSASGIQTAPVTPIATNRQGPSEVPYSVAPQPATILGTSLPSPVPVTLSEREQVRANMDANPHAIYVTQGTQANPSTIPPQAAPGAFNSLGVAPGRPRGPTMVGARHTFGYGSNPPSDQGIISTSSHSGIGENPSNAVSVSGANRMVALALEFKQFRVRQLSQACEFYQRAKAQMEAAEFNTVHEVHKGTIRDAKYLHNKQQEQLKQFVNWYQSRYQLHSQTNQQHYYQSQHRQRTSQHQAPPTAHNQQSHMQPNQLTPEQAQARLQRDTAILRQQLQQSLQHPSQTF